MASHRGGYRKHRRRRYRGGGAHPLSGGGAPVVTTTLAALILASPFWFGPFATFVLARLSGVPVSSIRTTEDGAYQIPFSRRNVNLPDRGPVGESPIETGTITARPTIRLMGSNIVDAYASAKIYRPLPYDGGTEVLDARADLWGNISLASMYRQAAGTCYQRGEGDLLVSWNRPGGAFANLAGHDVSLGAGSAAIGDIAGN